MRLSRQIVRICLIVAGLLAVLVAGLPIIQAGPRSPETWATIAAALAVLTAIISSWTSQRVLELQEDAQEPSITVNLDVRRRPQLVQLRVANVGGSVAKDIVISWEKPLLNVDGAPVRVGGVLEGPDVIPVLAPRDSTAVFVGVTNRFLEMYKGAVYSGIVRYKNASGAPRKQTFLVSVEAYRRSLIHDEEEALTQEELQKIPKQLKMIADELARLRKDLLSSRSQKEKDESLVENTPNPDPQADG